MNWYLKVLKQYVDFKGRARRKELWMFILFNMIITYSIAGITLALEMPELGIISTIYSLAVFLPNIGVWVRRMHDIGKSGWYCLIPFYNIYLGCLDSEEGTNAWGPNPKNPNTELDDIGLTEV